MYKIFKNELKAELGDFFKSKGFIYVGDERLLAFHDLLTCSITFENGSYKNRLDIYCSIGTPVLKDNFLDDFCNGDFAHKHFAIENSKWKMDLKIDKESKKTKVAEYIKEIKYIYENFLHYAISKEVNIFKLEERVKYKFGHYPVNSNLLKMIEKNKTLYYNKLDELFGNNKQSVIVDKSIFPISLDELMLNKDIIDFLATYSFVRNINKDTGGLPTLGETIYYKHQDKNIEVQVILENSIFLEFVVWEGDKFKRVLLHNMQQFKFGWLVGKANIIKENINDALKHLEVVLNEYKLN